VVAVCGDTAFYVFGATDDAALALNAGYALQWWIVEWLSTLPVRWYDLGGEALDAGLRQFKKGLVGKARRRRRGEREFDSLDGRRRAPRRGLDLPAPRRRSGAPSAPAAPRRRHARGRAAPEPMGTYAIAFLTEIGAATTAHRAARSSPTSAARTTVSPVGGAPVPLRRGPVPQRVQHGRVPDDLGPLHDRARVRERIGCEAEALVHLYGTMVRRLALRHARARAPHRVVDRTTGGDVPLRDVQQLADLMTLDVANRLEQLPGADVALADGARSPALRAGGALLPRAGAAGRAACVSAAELGGDRRGRRRSPRPALARGLNLDRPFARAL
jgi:hypothetical protein